MRNQEYGRSMIEMLGVLAIIGVLSVGGIAGYAKAMTKYRVNRTIDQVSMTVNGIQTLFANQPTRYADADNVDILQKAKIISDDMVEETETITFSSASNEAEYNYLKEHGDRYDFCDHGNLSNISSQECKSSPEKAGEAFLQSYGSRDVSKVITTPYGGHMTVTAGNKIFALNLLEVPTEMCVELVTLDWKGTADGCTGIAVGGKSTNGSAMAVSDAVAGCSTDFNTIVLTFK